MRLCQSIPLKARLFYILHKENALTKSLFLEDAYINKWRLGKEHMG
jgi:hypothetical protein